MSTLNWREVLGWSQEQLDELRFAGFSFLREGKYDKALLFFKALILLDPTSAYDRRTLGALYLQMGEGEPALHFLEQALQIEPDHEPTLLNKVKALLLLHRKPEALELARRLELSTDKAISDDAGALLYAYS